MNKNKDEEWRFIGFYGEPDAQNRHEAWARLKNLKSRGLAPWICVRDFNEITKQSEKLGGRTRPHAQIGVSIQVSVSGSCRVEVGVFD